MPKIFISYRRRDSYEFSHRIYDRLTKIFAKELIFIDDQTIPYGTAFLPFLERIIMESSLMIVVIGDFWKGQFNERDNKYDIEYGYDYVRREIEIAKYLYRARSLKIIPVFYSKTKNSSFEFPYEFTFISSINGLEIKLGKEYEGLDMLMKEIHNIDLKASNNIHLTTSIVNQGIDIGQKIQLMGGFKRKMPKDSKIEFFRYADDSKWNWSWTVYSTSDKIPHQYSFVYEGYYDFNRPIEETLGVLSEWYDIIPSPERCCKIVRKRKFVDILKHVFFGINRVSIKRLAPHYSHHSLLKMIQLFDRELNYKYVFENLRNDFVPPKEGENIEDYIYVGYFGRDKELFFGEYVCSLTYEAGSTNSNTGDLMLFPYFPDTRIKYLDFNSDPFFRNVQFIGHVGKNDFGYHIVTRY